MMIYNVKSIKSISKENFCIKINENLTELTFLIYDIRGKKSQENRFTSEAVNL